MIRQCLPSMISAGGSVSPELPLGVGSSEFPMTTAESFFAFFAGGIHSISIENASELAFEANERFLPSMMLTRGVALPELLSDVDSSELRMTTASSSISIGPDSSSGIALTGVEWLVFGLGLSSLSANDGRICRGFGATRTPALEKYQTRSNESMDHIQRVPLLALET